jgi:predicted phosphodiesterase
VTVGVITDVHGNRVALDAVLADAASVGIDEWWVLGDPIEADLCAGWAVIDGDDVDLRRVAYDLDAAIELTMSCGMPDHGRDAVVAHLRGERIVR